MTPYRPAVERFSEKIKLDPDTGCWIWIASFMRSGTPQFRFAGQPMSAFRASAELFLNGMPDGLEFDLSCGNAKCVNPNHFVFTEPMSDFQRFADNIVLDEATGCWNWTSWISAKGYALFRAHGTTWAHRVAYELFHGPIPEGLEVDHICRNRRCVCPTHLRAITHFENTDHDRRKTRCENGHDITDPANYYVLKTRYGTGKGRSCKICAIARSQERYYRLKKAQEAD